MKIILKGAALAAVTIAAGAAMPAQAQRLGGATIAIIDNDKVFSECTACKAASTQLQQQAQQIQQRAQQLEAPLQTEAQQLDTAVKALAGKQPDAALQQRVQAFQQRQQTAQQEIAGRQQGFQRNRAYVQQQIQTKLNPIYTQVMNARGATIALDIGATLASAASIDVTADVLAALNAQLPSVSTQAPPPPAQPAAQPGQPPKPAPQGR